jgi:multiple sugar transport system substrate-binding protein
MGAAALSGAQLLAACGAFGGGTGGNSGGSEADEVSGSFDWKREEGTTIRAILNKHPYTDALLPDLKTFTEKTRIKFEYDVFPEDSYFDKLTVALSSGQSTYDVFMTGAYQTWQYGPPGWLENLTPWIENESATSPDYDWEDVFPNLRAATRWNFKVGKPVGSGGQWALPWGFETNCITYQTDVWRKYGIKGPETFDDLIETAKFITAKEDGMYGIATRGSRNWGTIHPGFMTMYSRMGLKDYELGDGGLIPRMNTPGAVEFQKKWANMNREAGAPDWTSYSWYQVNSDMGARRVAMAFDADIGMYFVNLPKATAASGNIGWHPGPKGPDGSLATNLWVWSLGMSAKSQKKSAAWLFLQWATGKEHLHKAALESTHIDTVRQSIAGDPAYKNRFARTNAKGFLDTFDQVIDATKIQFTPQQKFFDTTTSWAAALQNIYRGEDAQGILDDLASNLKASVGS